MVEKRLNFSKVRAVALSLGDGADFFTGEVARLGFTTIVGCLLSSSTPEFAVSVSISESSLGCASSLGAGEFDVALDVKLSGPWTLFELPNCIADAVVEFRGSEVFEIEDGYAPVATGHKVTFPPWGEQGIVIPRR